MNKAFLPEYSQMPVGMRYRPLFRLFVGDNWKYVRKDGNPIECETASEAIAAAKECVKKILNPPIRAESITPVQPELVDEAKAFLSRREQKVTEERERVFGSMSTVFLKGGKQVPVETRNRRRT